MLRCKCCGRQEPEWQVALQTGTAVLSGLCNAAHSRSDRASFVDGRTDTACAFFFDGARTSRVQADLAVFVTHFEVSLKFGLGERCAPHTNLLTPPRFPCPAAFPLSACALTGLARHPGRYPAAQLNTLANTHHRRAVFDRSLAAAGLPFSSHPRCVR